MVNLSGFRFFELRLEKTFPNATGFQYNGSVNFPLSTARELNITKTLNGSKKLGAWLATPEGIQYVKTLEKNRYRRRFQSDQVMREKIGRQKP